MPDHGFTGDPYSPDVGAIHKSHTWNLHMSVPPVAPYLLKIVDYISFPRILGQLIRLDPQFENVEYTEDFPRDRPNTPMIVYRMIRRVPGMDKIETRKPRLRFWFRTEDNTITEIWSQWMTCIYQFDVCASSSQEADELVYKLDWFIRNNVGVFLGMGASELVFQEQLEDQLVPNTTDVVTRSIRWMARLESLEYRNTQVLNQVNIRVFEPQEEAYESMVRGADTDTIDELQQTYIANIACVSDPSPSGTARTQDYVPGVDFLVLYNDQTQKTALKWQEAGRKPAPGSTYYVRYTHWTAFARLRVPFF
jgi:hypothetical protein